MVFIDFHDLLNLTSFGPTPWHRIFSENRTQKIWLIRVFIYSTIQISVLMAKWLKSWTESLQYASSNSSRVIMITFGQSPWEWYGPSSYRLHSTTTVFSSRIALTTHESWYTIKQKKNQIKPNQSTIQLWVNYLY